MTGRSHTAAAWVSAVFFALLAGALAGYFVSLRDRQHRIAEVQVIQQAYSSNLCRGIRLSNQVLSGLLEDLLAHPPPDRTKATTAAFRLAVHRLEELDCRTISGG